MAGKNIKDCLAETAKGLSRIKDTEAGYEAADRFYEFDKALNDAYDAGELTAEEFNDLALEAFYDYFDLKETDKA